LYVAIDDTYGPNGPDLSRYVTGRRRSYVGVQFDDDEAAEVRHQLTDCLAAMPELFGVNPYEFHFVDIYNRSKVWKQATDGANLTVFEFFADIYRQYRWRVHLQTVDDRTLRDHRLTLKGRFDGIDLSKRPGQALFFLLAKIKATVPPEEGRLTVIVDEGMGKPGRSVGAAVFADWGDRYVGRYATSRQEPLLQIADFVAFCVNRSTHLALKAERSDTDLWFLNLVGSMGLRCDDLRQVSLTADFTVADFDDVHRADRESKGLE